MLYSHQSRDWCIEIVHLDKVDLIDEEVKDG